MFLMVFLESMEIREYLNSSGSLRVTLNLSPCFRGRIFFNHGGTKVHGVFPV